MPSPEDNKQLVQGILTEFQNSTPGSERAARWRRILKNWLYYFGFEVDEKRRLRRRQKGEADYSFEIEK